MGQAKKSLDDEYVSELDKYICADCIDDDYLKELVKNSLTKNKCSICKDEETHLIAAPVEPILNKIIDAIYAEYEDPIESVPYDGREGGYQWEVYNTEDLRDLIGFPIDDDDL